jgi:hypothetical protein
VTRVNAAAIATGAIRAQWPRGQYRLHPAVEAKRAFNTDDARMLMPWATNPHGPEHRRAHPAGGHKWVTVSSGPRQRDPDRAARASGMGTVINAYFADQASFPREAGDEIAKRFGMSPKNGGADDPYDEAAAWAMKCSATTCFRK